LLIIYSKSNLFNLRVVRLHESTENDEYKFNSNLLYDFPRELPCPLNPRSELPGNNDIKQTSSILNLSHFEIPKIFNLDIDLLPEKKWRRPGAKLADYFNYGIEY